MSIERLFEELCDRPEVEALALGGSRATGKADSRSDYDIYIYLTKELPNQVRSDILTRYCSVCEIGNHYWESEDNCTLHNGIDIDIIYRDLDVFTGEIEHVVEQYNAGNGYTTCLYHNLLTSDIRYDRDCRLQALKDRFTIPYPKKLKQNIIHNNMNLLSGVLPSFDMQIKKAIKRYDRVSINHRVTEFLASYFDIILALNEKTHPGEKRLVQFCTEQCSILPKDMEKNLNRLFDTMFSDPELSVIVDIINELKKVIVDAKIYLPKE